jgi:hypothetical protein
MKVASPPCSFKFYNKENPDGSAPDKYKVEGTASGGETGILSDIFIVSGNRLYIDSLSISVNLTVTDPASIFSGTAQATFVFPAEHYNLLLDGHPVLAEKDVLTQEVSFRGKIAGVDPIVVVSYSVTGEITASGQNGLDDWSQI